MHSFWKNPSATFVFLATATAIVFAGTLGCGGGMGGGGDDPAPPPANRVPMITRATINQNTGIAGVTPIQFRLSGMDLDNNALTYYIDFDGDGVMDASIPYSQPAEVQVEHVFPAAGIYKSKVVLSDGKDNSAYTFAGITITDPLPGNNPPSVSGSCLPATGVATQTVFSCTLTGTDKESDVLQYRLNTGTGFTPYSDSNTFQFTLPVGTFSPLGQAKEKFTNPSLESAIVGLNTLTVTQQQVNQRPTASASISPGSGLVGSTFTVPVVCSDPEGDATEGMVVDFGDGISSSYSASPTFTHQYSSTGTFRPTVRCKDAGGEGPLASSSNSATVTQQQNNNIVNVALRSLKDGSAINGYVKLSGPVTQEKTGEDVSFTGLPDGTYTRISDDENDPGTKGVYSRRTDTIQVSGGQTVSLTDKLIPHDMGGDSNYGPWYDWSMVNFLRGMASSPVDGTRAYGLVERVGSTTGGKWLQQVKYAFNGGTDINNNRVRTIISDWEATTGADQFVEVAYGSHNCEVDMTVGSPSSNSTINNGEIVSSFVGLPVGSDQQTIQFETFYRNLHGRNFGVYDIKNIVSIVNNGYTNGLWIADQLLYEIGLAIDELEKHAAE